METQTANDVNVTCQHHGIYICNRSDIKSIFFPLIDYSFLFCWQYRVAYELYMSTIIKMNIPFVFRGRSLSLLPRACWHSLAKRRFYRLLRVYGWFIRCAVHRSTTSRGRNLRVLPAPERHWCYYASWRPAWIKDGWRGMEHRDWRHYGDDRKDDGVWEATRANGEFCSGLWSNKYFNFQVLCWYNHKLRFVTFHSLG